MTPLSLEVPAKGFFRMVSLGGIVFFQVYVMELDVTAVEIGLT